jgi:ABC-type sugar transport system permease subunit/ABC-type glycerol-3-phosphate transport system substrate-binding protein
LLSLFSLTDRSICPPDGESHLSGRAAWTRLVCALCLLLTILAPLAAADTGTVNDQDTIDLRAWRSPAYYGSGPVAEAEREIIHAFRELYPTVNPVSTEGLVIPGKTRDIVPFMQIAGGIAPDVLYVAFRQSQTYIGMGLLYPLDNYVEAMAGVQIDDDAAAQMSTAEYVDLLKQGKGWQDIADRVPEQCWQVIRRKSRDGDGYHIYAFPAGPLVMGMTFNRPLFAEHADLGVQMRPPTDWEEMLSWAKLMTDPQQNRYGLYVDANTPSWHFANLLYSAGGNVVHQVRADEVEHFRKKFVNVREGDWVCVFDTDEAVEAAYYWARLRHEKVERDGELVCYGVVRASSSKTGEAIDYAMGFASLDYRFLDGAQDQTMGFGPVPKGPTGLSRSQFNSRLLGIFSGLADDDTRRDAAWDYITFYDGAEARRIRVEKLVEAGLGPFMPRRLLERYNTDGRYDSVIRRISPELERTYQIASAGGVPEPYGKNCQYVYDEMAKPLDEIWNDRDGRIRAAINAGDKEQATTIIRGILQRATEKINVRMLGNLPPDVAKRRNAISWGVIAIVLVGFLWVMRVVLKAFTPEHRSDLDGWQFAKHWKAYLLASPALLMIGMWMYWPMARGTTIAFQDYSVIGQSEWIGASNFSEVLFSGEFWYSVWITALYAMMFMVFGFCVPIVLAFLLSEVPKGKLIFRTIFYLPAVLTGLVVIIMWKGFYSPDGMINDLLNGVVWLMNLFPGVQMDLFREDWLQNPRWALFFCLLPTVWAGMGPGCLIYLAALKTIPEEIYEAADIDGAGIRYKITHVAIPTIKVLVMINFVGAMIGAIRGSGGFVLAMTGGGPYSSLGGATEVVGLKLFFTTFGYLKFGVGAAMAWVIGAMLIGFTVLQFKRLSNVEFRTAGGD